MARQTRWVLGAVLVAVVTAMGATALWLWPSTGNAPLRLRAESAPASPAGSVPGDPLAGALERFVIVPSESSARYRVGETFFTNNRFNVAVGTTRAISGEIFVDRRRLANSRLGLVVVDISQLTSDQARRDRAIRDRWLESARYPRAEFRVDRIEGLPESYREGETVPVTLHGRLTVREVERPVTFVGSMVLAGDTLRGTATTTIRMTDFGFDPPSILGMLRAENEVQIEVDIVARQAAG